ncbi:MAG: sugar ABC transporter ATP-binding protein [Sphaerochaetaceae bacterium]|nr:sugar ABC transporter ATP-binding protein [Sphaerochaetaceae bacterium]
MGHKLLEIEQISKFFPGVKALQNVSFDVEESEIHALIGENGAGKSTLIKVLSGIYQPEEGGRIKMNGEVLENINPLMSLSKGIVVIYQDFSLFPNMSVAENISLGLFVSAGKKTVNRKKMDEIAKEALSKLEVNIDIHANLSELSVAKQQLVAIARALANQAKILILDEPTSALSTDEVKSLFKIMKNLKADGISMIFISHKLDELFEVSDRFTVLRDGQCVGTYNEDQLDDDLLISLMVGRKVEYKIYEKVICDEPLLEVRNFSKEGNFKNINFTLNKGEILGITGLVGAGRTEVVTSIFGLNPKDSGQLVLDGNKIEINKTSEAINHGIALIPENRLQEGLLLRKAINDNISMTILKRLSGRFGIIDDDEKNSVVKKWIEKLNIKPGYPKMLASKFSGGNQQRIVIAKWLATNPKVLIVDEPTNGIDIGAKAEIHSLLRELAKSGLGIIVISSELPEILSVCDRVAIMRRGNIKKILSCDSLDQEKIMSYAL